VTILKIQHIYRW